MRGILAWAALVACSSAPARPRAADERSRPPVAARHPHEVRSPHGTRDDPYFWLRDDTRSDPAVLAYLEAENAYARHVLAPLRGLEDTLLAEMRARTAPDESTPPVFEDGYWYYTRFEPGKQHAIYARRKDRVDASEQRLLDENELAAGHAFYTIGARAASRDGKLLAWLDDRTGGDRFVLHVVDLTTGKLLADTATDLAPQLAWANDNRTLFYVARDPTTSREDRVFRHRIGGPHELVYAERDTAYSIALAVTRSRRYIAIELDTTTTSETRLVDADRPASAPQLFLPREHGHIYAIDHLDDRFVLRTNAGADNFRVVEVAAGRQADRRAWRDVVPHRRDAFVEDFAVGTGYVAAAVRIDGLRRLEIVAQQRPAFFVDARDPAYAMTLIHVPGASSRVRYTYDSPTTPTVTFELDVATGERTLLHRTPTPTYDATRYTSEYVRAIARDGARIPVSIVYRIGTRRDGTAPLLVSGYGAYGESIDPVWERVPVDLLDRGWVFAIAHVRGGSELGNAWYDAGRLANKHNTFDDFVAVTEYLIANRYAARDRVCAEGASAGGLLVAAVANRRPELYRGIVAWVPFVDVVTTMLDASIPLVTNEYEEWGDPRDRAAYASMLAYSPYDNVRRQRYPALYVRTALWDSRVPYHESAKWVAKLRATKTDDHPLVLEVDMHAGHEGSSGRFDALREVARTHAFLIDVAR